MTAAPTPPETPAKENPTFDAMPLGADVRKAVDALGYVHPTPVQLAVFEPAVRGRSLVVQARTGTGKTAAFGLPIIDALVKRSTPAVQALILTPTRELALQVGREIEQLAQFRGTKVVPIYGGAPMGRQISALEEGAQVVVGTPGRVLDHLRRGTLDPSNIRIFVLDEADEMLSMGFAKELNAIIETLPKERQGLYFSATLPPDVERLATNHLKDPEWVTLSSDQVGALEISHFVYLVREGDKRGALARILEVEDPESAIVFCNTKDETERVAEMLKNRGYDADWLNGDLDQRDRERVMNATKEGKLRYLVATDVAARGIDISHLTHVVNADFPESAEQYVHRTGRTGRAGRTGTAISVVGPKDVGHLYMLRLTYKIRPVERMLPTEGELRTRAEADMIAFLAEAYASKAQDPAHLAVARRLLTHDNAAVVIAGLLADHLGASTRDVPQDASDARRAKNPAPAPAPAAPAAPERRAREAREPRERDARRGNEPSPRTLRDGERPARPAQAQAQAQPERSRSAPEDDRTPSTLSEWEPPPEKDDDAPLFRETRETRDMPIEAGTKPGIGAAAPPAQRRPRPEEGRLRGGRRARGRSPDEATRDTESIDVDDSNSNLPRYHIEDHPTVVYGGEPAPAAEPPARGRGGERGDRAGRGDRGDRGDRGERDEVDPAFANVFLNVGRRDGLRTEDVQRLLVETAGLAEGDVGHIRLRDRMTFVGIRKEHVERAMKSLIGVPIGERTLNAEPAKDR